MDEKIKSCPFDLTGTHQQKVKATKSYYHVVCSCGARGPGNYSEKSAIDSWNSYTTARNLKAWRE